MRSTSAPVPPPRTPPTDDVRPTRERTRTDGGLTQGVLGHRLDIQGLRAVAVLLVVLGHGGVWFLRGGFIGVDVFFVLSGFLITRLMLEETGRNSRVSLSRFYARRAKRILPAAALTLIVTAIAARLLMNVVRAEQAIVDGVWAAFFAANLQFARQGVDYFAQGDPPSPVQHYWSLAVEEQFYLVWPLVLSVVFAGAAWQRWIGRRRADGDAAPSAGNVRRLAVVIAVAGLASLAWSIYFTPRTPAAAYFSTMARAWELALGAGLAIGATRFLDLSDRTRALMGWAGALGIVAAAVLFSATTPFPGYAALLPTLGTAMVIAAGIGNERSPGGVGGWLGRAPLRYVGDRSYAFYLWHWPALTIAAFWVGHDLPLGVNLLLLGGAFLLSILSYGLIENPIRRAKLTRPIRTSALLWATSVGLVLVVGVVNLRSIGALDDPKGPLPILAPFVPGKAGVLPEVVAAVDAARRDDPLPATLVPPPNRLLADNYHFPSEDCFAENGEPRSRTICKLGPKEATRTMVVFGDSHARHWMPSILWTADRDGWRVLPIIELGCGPSHYAVECRPFIEWALEEVERLQPDVVLISGQYLLSHPEQVRANVIGTGELVAAMEPLAGDVIVIGDPPAHRQQPVDCLLAPDATMGTCTLTRTPAQISTYRGVAAATKTFGGAFLDTLGWFCYQHQCPTVIRNTIAYRDDSHVSVTYALQLRALFRDALNRALSGDPPGAGPG